MSTQEIRFPHVCAPVDYDKYLDGILSAIYRVGKASTSKEIQQKDSTLGDFVCIGRACSFLSYLGLVKGSKSPFELSTDGRDIAIALAENKGERVLEIWKKTLLAHSLYSELQNYMETQGGKTGSSLGFGEHLRKLSGKSYNTKYVQEGGKRIAVLLASKGLINFDRDNDTISFPASGTQKPVQPPPITPPQAPPTPTTVTVKSGSQPGATIPSTLPFSINISVEAKDPDSIKQVIALIRELTGKKSET
jgi:hypothetical protein